MWPGFIERVRTGFAPLTEAHGLREVSHFESYAYQNVLFTNDQGAIRFYLDVRDGYLDAQYAPASTFAPSGQLASPAIHSAGTLRSVERLLKPEGVSWPTREGGLFEPGVLEKAVDDLIDGIARHAEVVLGPT